MNSPTSTDYSKFAFGRDTRPSYIEYDNNVTPSKVFGDRSIIVDVVARGSSQASKAARGGILEEKLTGPAEAAWVCVSQACVNFVSVKKNSASERRGGGEEEKKRRGEESEERRRDAGVTKAARGRRRRDWRVESF